MITDVTEKIKLRRKEFGLSDIDVSKSAGLSIHEYGDLEQHADEIFTVTEFHKVKKLLQVLKLDFFELTETGCAFCDEGHPYVKDYSLPRHELICKKRDDIGISREELGDRLGFYEIEIENLESDPNQLDTWPIELIKNLSNEINVPLQILLNIKCKRCEKIKKGPEHNI